MNLGDPGQDPLGEVQALERNLQNRHEGFQLLPWSPGETMNSPETHFLPQHLAEMEVLHTGENMLMWGPDIIRYRRGVRAPCVSESKFPLLPVPYIARAPPLPGHPTRLSTAH